jgi:hypothetical protein
MTNDQFPAVLSGRGGFGSATQPGTGRHWPEAPGKLAQFTEAVTQSDRRIVRELAARVAELAALDVNAERIGRIKATNGLRPVRPVVWIDEIPWHELAADAELALRCESALAREVEERLRRTLYQWDHFQADMVVEPFFRVGKAFDDTGVGIGVEEETLSTGGDVVSHRYEDQLEDEAVLETLHPSTITARPDVDQVTVAALEDLLGGTLPIELHGHVVFYVPWDDVVTLRGVENCLFDMLDRPEYMHRTIEVFTEIGQSRLTQLEALDLLDFRLPDLHCTPPYCDELPAAGWDGGKVRLRDVWFRGAGQLFSSASPAMRDEFDLAYMREPMSRCGLVYYGCCEPLDKAMPYLKTIPNLRKITVTPWADVRACAEQMGPSYVAAMKPNPALLAGRLDRAMVVQEIVEAVEAFQASGTPFEIVLKDLSTAGDAGRENLSNWAQTVASTLDRYY